MGFNGAGALGGAGQGAAAGTAILPGWGTAIGAVAGGALGAFSPDGSDNSDLKDALARANNANKQRYQQLLSNASSQRLDANGALNTQYAQLFNMNDSLNLDAPLQRNAMATRSAVGGANQAFAGRGLYNSTAAANAATGAQREGNLRGEEIRNQATNVGMGLRERYSSGLQNVIGNYYNTLNGTISNVQDQSPNIAAYAQLASQQGNPYGSALQQVSGSIQGAASAYNQNQLTDAMTQYYKNKAGAAAPSGNTPPAYAYTGI